MGNNRIYLIDLSMNRQYSALCGITAEELTANFDEDVRDLAAAQGLTVEQAYEELRLRYDGYHFASNSCGMYNPFSLFNTLKRKQFGNYWFATGTPSYLVYLLQKHHYNLEQMEHVETTEAVLDSIDPDSTNPIPIIYQSGYLTIKSYDREFGIYNLGYPNQEVEEGFVEYLMPFYTNTDKINSPFEIRKF